VTLGLYSRFAKDPDGRPFDIWVQARGTVLSNNVRWTPIGEPLGRLVQRRYPGDFWVCVQRRRRVSGTRRWRYGPYGEAEARDVPDLLYVHIREGSWQPRDPEMRLGGWFWRRVPGGR
jgi:hypothetical protein